jgi:hypothetical protein
VGRSTSPIEPAPTGVAVVTPTVVSPTTAA